MRKAGTESTFSPRAVTFSTIFKNQIVACLATAAVPRAPAAVTLRSILEQKYIAMLLNPDTWSDIRRRDFSPSHYVSLKYPTYGSCP